MSDRTSEDLQRFISHLPLNSTDKVLVVLKGHLLVEELLREYVDLHVIHKNKLKDARLTFHQCLCLAQAFCNDETKTKLWESVKQLNALRNKLAHKLEPKDIEIKLSEFINLLSAFNAESDFADQEKNFGVLTSCLLSICLSLSATLRDIEN